MAYWGQGWGTFWGDPENWLLFFDLTDFVTGVKVDFEVTPGYSQYYQLIIDGVNVGPPVFFSEGSPHEIVGNYPFDTPDKKHVVSLIGQGPWNNNNFDATVAQLDWESKRSDKIKLNIGANPDMFSIGDNGTLTNWQMGGWQRYMNCRAVKDRSTWAELDLSVAFSHTEDLIIVTLSLSGVVMSQGTVVPIHGASSAGSFTAKYNVILFPFNNSGLGGTVDLVFEGEITNALLVAAFPALYKVYYRETPFTSADFSNSNHVLPQAIIHDDGHSINYPFESPALSGPNSAATFGHNWYVVTHQVSETDVESTGVQNQLINLVYAPKSPGCPVLVSTGSGGPGSEDHTQIEWEASVDGGSSYNVYDSGTGLILPQLPTFNVPPGHGIIRAILPALTGPIPFNGVRYVMVRSLLEGIEDGNTCVLQIVYVNGIPQPALPNSPAMSIQITTVDRTLTVPFTLDTNQAKSIATEVQLFAWAVGTKPDFNSPIGFVILGVPEAGTVIYGHVTGTVAFDGLYFYGIKAKSPDGQDLNTNFAGPVRLSFVAPLDPTTILQGAV